MRKTLGTILGIVMALVAVACSSDPGALPKVPEFTPAPTTTTGIDYSEIGLKPVPGKSPTTSVVFGPGTASVGGTIIGDEGPVAGATIHVERIVSGSVGVMTLQSAEDGSWTLPQILGGRYRARAWRAPDLAQTSWTAVFLGADENKTVQLRVRTLGGLSVTSAIAPDPPVLFQDANLVVQVTLKTVDEQGVVRATPQDNVQVELIGSGSWRVQSENPTVTDSRGRAEWILRCRQSGRQSLAVTVGTQTIPLDISDCVEPPEETTTTTSESGLVP